MLDYLKKAKTIILDPQSRGLPLSVTGLCIILSISSWFFPSITGISVIILLWVLFIIIVAIDHRNRFHQADRLRGVDYEQLEAMTQILNLVKLRMPLPKLRGGAASPDLLLVLFREIVSKHPEILVECGAGTSTIWIGYILEQIGHGQLITLEHDEIWAQRTRNWIIQHGLESRVRVIDAPLVSYATENRTVIWYDKDSFIRYLVKPVEFLFVDGPIGVVDSYARYPALSLLRESISSDCTIVLDDTNRKGERETALKWAEILNYECDFIDCEKGAAILTPASKPISSL
jgi:hypothetical protein